MLMTLLKGIVIGAIISAPLGPVGVLCLRETLYGGQREGLLTGVGAMLSDVLYGFLVYWGLGLVLDLLVRYDSHLRILGGAIILIFAFILFTKAKTEIKQSPTRRLSKLHGMRKVATAFFVTLANPFIVFLILPLYTRFSFVQESSTPGWELFVALLGLAMGCMLWWYILTTSVRQLVRRVGPRVVRVISRIIAVILASIGMIGIYSGVDTLLSDESGASSRKAYELASQDLETSSRVVRFTLNDKIN